MLLGDDIGLEADTIEPDSDDPVSDDGNAGEKARLNPPPSEGYFIFTVASAAYEQDGEAEGLCTGQSDRNALKGSKVPELLAAGAAVGLCPLEWPLSEAESPIRALDVGLLGRVAALTQS